MMNIKAPVEIIEDIRIALASRKYDDFVNLFSEDGVLESPFALQNSASRLEGIDNIRKRFINNSALESINKLFELHKVNAIIHPGVDLNLATVEFSVEGKNITTGDFFKLASSVAVISFKDGKIKNYRDYPNTMGLAAAVGMLPQLAASFTK